MKDLLEKCGMAINLTSAGESKIRWICLDTSKII